MALAAAPAAARGAALPLVGFLHPGRKDDPAAAAFEAAFHTGLAGQGWKDGENVTVVLRHAGGDAVAMPALAAELIALDPAALYTAGTPPTAVLTHATSAIPVVLAEVSDPVGSGFVESLARPGHPATGFTPCEPTMAGRWVELLTQLVPTIRTIGAIYNPGTAVRAGRFYLEPLEDAAARLGLRVEAMEVQSDDDIAARVGALGAASEAGIVVIPDIFMVSHRPAVFAAVERAGRAAVYFARQFAEAGLVCDGDDIADGYRSGGDYVGRILHGASPAELPVQAASKFDLIVNLRTAAAQGLTVPPNLLATATEVIE
jgi:putative ABC transport system substrate-binding protein